MTIITIHLSDEKSELLKNKAARLQVAPETLVQASIDDLLARPDDAFEQALERVLGKTRNSTDDWRPGHDLMSDSVLHDFGYINFSRRKTTRVNTTTDAETKYFLQCVAQIVIY